MLPLHNSGETKGGGGSSFHFPWISRFFWFGYFFSLVVVSRVSSSFVLFYLVSSFSFLFFSSFFPHFQSISWLVDIAEMAQKSGTTHADMIQKI